MNLGLDLGLIASAGLMGLAGAPHCAAMCGAPCAVLAQRCSAPRPPAGAGLAAFLGGRLAGYMAAGAVVAASVSALAALGDWAPALRPLWTLVHLAALGFGVWLLVAGRMPGWLGTTRLAWAGAPQPALPAGWQRIRGPLRAGTAGTLWFVLPCGLLQAALIVASLASTPWQGAAAMAAFATTSSLGLLAHPLSWLPAPARLRSGAWVVRASGAALAVGSAWALSHGLWERIAAFCR